MKKIRRVIKRNEKNAMRTKMNVIEIKDDG